MGRPDIVPIDYPRSSSEPRSFPNLLLYITQDLESHTEEDTKENLI